MAAGVCSVPGGRVGWHDGIVAITRRRDPQSQPFSAFGKNRPISGLPSATGNSYVFRYPVIRTGFPYVLAECGVGPCERIKRPEIGSRNSNVSRPGRAGFTNRSRVRLLQAAVSLRNSREPIHSTSAMERRAVRFMSGVSRRTVLASGSSLCGTHEQLLRRQFGCYFGMRASRIVE